MKISAKTLEAARKAAAKQNMTLDSWADKALARAASSRQPADVEAMLRKISRKIDQIADRQSVGEKANAQVAAALEDLGSSYDQVKKTTGRAFNLVRTRTGTAVGEMAEKAMEAFGHMTKSATELAETLAPKSAEDAAAEPVPPAPKKSKSAAKPRAKKAAAAKATPRRRSTSASQS